MTFFCLLFLCQDKKRRWGLVGASPHPMSDEGLDPGDFPIHIGIGMWGPVGASPTLWQTKGRARMVSPYI